MCTHTTFTVLLVLCSANCAVKEGASAATEDSSAASAQASAADTNSQEQVTVTVPESSGPTTGGAEPTTGGTEPTTGGNAEGPCSIKNQDCTEGMKCVPFSSQGANLDSAHCIPVPRMPSASGQACKIGSGLYYNQVDDCEAGNFCYYVTLGATEGVCVEFCEQDPGCANPGTVCSVLIDGGWLNLCVTLCDPLQLQPQCSEGGICAAGFETFHCMQKVDPNDEEFGQQCNGLYDCKPGLACVAPGNVPSCDGFCCTEYCDINNPDACQAHPPQECIPFFEMDNLEWGDVGACLIP